MKEVKTTVYIAEDGTQFNTAEECVIHEMGNLAISEVFKKIKFCTEAGIEIPFSSEELTLFYFEKKQELTSIDFDNVYIVKISKEATSKELIILKKFLDLINYEVLDMKISKIYPGAVFCWDTDLEIWRDTMDMLRTLREKYNVIRELQIF